MWWWAKYLVSSNVQVNGLEPASEEEQQRAAVKIQAGIRGYRDRQRVKALRSVNTIYYWRHINMLV